MVLSQVRSSADCSACHHFEVFCMPQTYLPLIVATRHMFKCFLVLTHKSRIFVFDGCTDYFPFRFHPLPKKKAHRRAVDPQGHALGNPLVTRRRRCGGLRLELHLLLLLLAQRHHWKASAVVTGRGDGSWRHSAARVATTSAGIAPSEGGHKMCRRQLRVQPSRRSHPARACNDWSSSTKRLTLNKTGAWWWWSSSVVVVVGVRVGGGRGGREEGEREEGTRRRRWSGSTFSCASCCL